MFPSIAEMKTVYTVLTCFTVLETVLYFPIIFPLRGYKSSFCTKIFILLCFTTWFQSYFGKGWRNLDTFSLSDEDYGSEGIEKEDRSALKVRVDIYFQQSVNLDHSSVPLWESGNDPVIR